MEGQDFWKLINWIIAAISLAPVKSRCWTGVTLEVIAILQEYGQATSQEEEAGRVGEAPLPISEPDL